MSYTRGSGKIRSDSIADAVLHEQNLHASSKTPTASQRGGKPDVNSGGEEVDQSSVTAWGQRRMHEAFNITIALSGDVLSVLCVKKMIF